MTISIFKRGCETSMCPCDGTECDVELMRWGLSLPSLSNFVGFRFYSLHIVLHRKQRLRAVFKQQSTFSVSTGIASSKHKEGSENSRQFFNLDTYSMVRITLNTECVLYCFYTKILKNTCKSETSQPCLHTLI